MTPQMSPDILFMIMALFGAAILSGLIENVTKKKRTKEDDLKVITGLIIGSLLFIIIFPKITLFIIFIIISILFIRKKFNI